MEQTQILVVDDNPEIREIIKILLEGEGYQVRLASDGNEALKILSEQEEIDLIILDIMMPHLNGYQTCVEIRRTCNAPILFLSAKTQESDKTLGFSSGGDDYLAKPFSYNELVSRTKALIRRYQVYRGKQDIPSGKQDAQNAFSDKQGVPFGYEGVLPHRQDMPYGRPDMSADSQSPLSDSQDIFYRELRINQAKRKVWAGEKELVLTDTEYEILLLLVLHRGQIFSAEHLYESVWNEPYYYGAGNTVMVHIRNLRRKIEKDPANPDLIKTIWGKGYRCDAKNTGF